MILCELKLGQHCHSLHNDQTELALAIAPAYHLEITPPKTNMEPENHPFEEEKHLPNLHFGVPC